MGSDRELLKYVRLSDASLIYNVEVHVWEYEIRNAFKPHTTTARWARTMNGSRVTSTSIKFVKSSTTSYSDG